MLYTAQAVWYPEFFGQYLKLTLSWCRPQGAHQEFFLTVGRTSSRVSQLGRTWQLFGVSSNTKGIWAANQAVLRSSVLQHVLPHRLPPAALGDTAAAAAATCQR